MSGEGVYVGRLVRLGHQNEIVCIVSGEGVYVRRSGFLGHENKTVCIMSGEGVYVGDRGAWDTRIRLYVL